jgi:acylphosphatase
MTIALRMQIAGLVQGVFFRDWTVAQARSLGVTGWVRNRRDGSVEALAIGAAEAVDNFVARLRQGSPQSRVDTIHIEPAELQRFPDFARAATV